MRQKQVPDTPVRVVREFPQKLEKVHFLRFLEFLGRYFVPPLPLDSRKAEQESQAFGVPLEINAPKSQQDQIKLVLLYFKLCKLLRVQCC